MQNVINLSATVHKLSRLNSEKRKKLSCDAENNTAFASAGRNSVQRNMSITVLALSKKVNLHKIKTESTMSSTICLCVIGENLSLQTINNPPPPKKKIVLQHAKGKQRTFWGLLIFPTDY